MCQLNDYLYETINYHFPIQSLGLMWALRTLPHSTSLPKWLYRSLIKYFHPKIPFVKIYDQEFNTTTSFKMTLSNLKSSMSMAWIGDVEGSIFSHLFGAITWGGKTDELRRKQPECKLIKGWWTTLKMLYKMMCK